LQFDSSGTLNTLVSANGGRWTVVRNGGLVSAIVNPLNRRVSYSWDGNNNLRRIQDAAGRITSFVVDASSNLTQVKRADGSSVNLRYLTNHLLSAVIDADNRRTSYIYSTYDYYRKRVTAVQLPAGMRVSYMYCNQATLVADGADQVATFAYDCS